MLGPIVRGTEKGGCSLVCLPETRIFTLGAEQEKSRKSGRARKWLGEKEKGEENKKEKKKGLGGGGGTPMGVFSRI